MSQLATLAAVLGWVAGALLILAGAAKVRAPEGTVTALTAARFPGSPVLVRGLGTVEVLAGAAVLALGGIVPAVAGVLLYAGFTGFVLRQRRSAGASCGCFGAERSPVTAAHVAVNVLAALALAGAAATTAEPVTSLAAGGTIATRAATVVLVVLGAWLVRLVLTAGAALTAAVELHPRPEGTA